MIWAPVFVHRVIGSMQSLKHWPLVFVLWGLGCPLPAAAAAASPPAAMDMLRHEQPFSHRWIAQANQASAWDLYKAGNYSAALQKFKESAAKDPQNPKNYWGMTLVHNKLKQYQQAQASLDQAVKIDPTISFTEGNSYSKLRIAIEKNLAKSGQGTKSSTTLPSEPVLSQSADLIVTLKDAPLFVSPTMQSTVNPERLSQSARSVEPFTVKFAVLDAVSGDRQAYAQEIFDYLNLENGAVIVATKKGVDLYSDRFDQGTATELAKQSRVQFTPTDYTAGLANLAQSATDQIKSQTDQRNVLIGGAIATLGAGAGAVALGRRRRRRKHRAELEEMRSQVATTLSDMQSYVQVLPDNAHAAKAGQFYDQASQRFLQASDVLEQNQIGSAPLQQAEADIHSAQNLLKDVRREIDLATGATPETIPQDPETASACFFCSRPQSLQHLQPHLLQVNRLEKQVLCCSACSAQLNAGKTPKVRTVKRKGRQIPWYRDRDYNPYRDYYRYEQDWYSTTVYDIDFDNRDDDVVIYADQSQYRNYQVDQTTDWQASNTASETAFAFSESPAPQPEASTETDFFWANDAPDVADSSGESGFFDSDIS